MIRITSKREGFRRAGIAHSKEPTEYADDHFSKAELKILQAEKMLIVETGEVKKTAVKQLNVGETVALVANVEKLAALDSMVVGETRKGVIEAIEKKRAELTLSTDEK